MQDNRHLNGLNYEYPHDHYTPFHVKLKAFEYFSEFFLP